MLKVAHHRPMSSPWVVSGLDTDELKYCHGDKQGGDTVEELEDDEPQEVLSTGSPNKL